MKILNRKDLVNHQPYYAGKLNDWGKALNQP